MYMREKLILCPINGRIKSIIIVNFNLNQSETIPFYLNKGFHKLTGLLTV